MNRNGLINKFLGGQEFNIAATAMLLLAVVCYVAMHDTPVFGNTGLCLPSCNLWLGGGWLSALVNVGCIVGAGYMLKYINRLHGFIRANAAIAMSVFFMLELATPRLSGYLHEGTAMMLVIITSAYIIFGTFHLRISQRSIFLAFALLSLYTMFQFSALYLVIVFFLGFVQMRVMRLRGFVAMILGLLTPYWIAYGFGIIDFDSFAIPEIRNVWQTLDTPQSWVLIATCAVTVIATLSLMLFNMMHIISYNAKRRACNGFFFILAITTIIMMGVDYTNVLAYLPTLNLCLAIQVGHAYTRSSNELRYIPILVFCAICLGTYVYNF